MLEANYIPTECRGVFPWPAWFMYLLSIVWILVYLKGKKHHHKNLDTILEKIYVQIQGNKRGSIYKDYCAVQTKHIDVNLSTG